MRFAALFAAASVTVTGIAASPLSTGINIEALVPGVDLSASNSYGAPNPPWALNGQPGWYYGQYPSLFPDLICLEGVGFSCMTLTYEFANKSLSSLSARF